MIIQIEGKKKKNNFFFLLLKNDVEYIYNDDLRENFFLIVY
jgi:hypothetical protein